ncbi:hypothetical protein G7Y89_g9639 [Cudoniella acicularis]|uniref:Heterokaryon incompatibility domain-containing protein n=1 Tax=Cudoniella acicularis TaxID=354080 RepID=A0A8H4W1P6_9HELO|nr:hypothetical protein G7Y89_g9639 [Cudoniella acicularis]
MPSDQEFTSSLVRDQLGRQAPDEQQSSISMATIVQKPHSCKHCQRLTFQSPIQSNHDYEFDFSLTAVYQAATEGCTFCQWFLDEIRASSKWQRIAEKPETHNMWKLYAYVNAFSTEIPRSIGWFGIAEALDRNNQVTGSNGFNVCTPSDNAASCDIGSRPIYRAVGSDHHFGMAQNWLEECITNHGCCPKSEKSFMPTRVIEITKNETGWHPCLHHSTSTAVGPYVALSYCWGGDQVIKTTKLTIKDWGVSLPFEILPKTLQDAIIVTSKLNIRYLWVDALCIIQDDPEDMAQEMSQMARIYSSAVVTVAASRARTVNEGFLQVRDAGDPPHLMFELPYKTRTGELGSITLHSPSRHLGIVERREPLDVRAWAFQERFLSPRLLDYRSHQLRWLCRVRSSSQEPRYVDGMAALHEPFISTNARNWIFDQLDGLDPDDQENVLLGHWSAIVESYSACSLTFFSDKLPALSAAAEKFGSVLSASYVAGMWTNTLHFNLCWYRKKFFWPPSNPRPREYQAPSWSWASINEPVEMCSPENYRSEDEFLLQVLHCDVRLKNVMAPYGAVTSGVLTVKGCMKQIQGIVDEYSEVASMAIKEGSNMVPIRVYLDALEDGFAQDGEDSTLVFALEVTMYCRDFSSRPEKGHQGLLLCKSQATNENSVYRRVGYFDTREEPALPRLPEESREEWQLRNYECLTRFDDCEPQVITII